MTIFEELEQNKSDYIGGTLMDIGDPQHPRNVHATDDQVSGHDTATILNIELRRTRRDDIPYYFEVRGNHTTCGFDLKIGRFDGKFEDEHGREWLHFYGHHNHHFRITKKV